jgi:hypothetical protein
MDGYVAKSIQMKPSDSPGPSIGGTISCRAWKV